MICCLFTGDSCLELIIDENMKFNLLLVSLKWIQKREPNVKQITMAIIENVILSVFAIDDLLLLKYFVANNE